MTVSCCVIYYDIFSAVVNDLKLILAGNIDSEILGSLQHRGFEIIKTPYNPRLLKGLNYHADMQIAKIRDCFICDPSLHDEYLKLLKGTNAVLKPGKAICDCNYPKDIAYNIKAIGKKVFHNFKYTDEVLKNQLSEETLINVSQGYSGCSICKISDSAIITSDKIIHKSAKDNNLNSLLISPGHILLDGFNYGFIGGASFLAGETLYFFGNISMHPDYESIKKFCDDNNREFISLSEKQLSDFGSAITVD